LESAALPDGTSYSKTIGPDPRWGIQIPITTSESLTRGNLTMNIASSRAATLADPSNPFSLTTQTDTLSINGRAYSFVFTGATKTAVSTTPAGRKTTTVLDAQERVSSVQPAGLALSSYGYDSRGRLSSLLQGTRNTTYTYDSNGNLASATNPLGLTIGFTHDATGNLLTATLADGRIITYTYDANGNLKSVTPPGGSPHNYSYSAVNLATAYTPPSVAGAGATTYTFNADRDLTKITRPDGAIVTYKYDTAGRLSSVVTPASTISYVYSATTGNISKASVSSGEAIAYAYNGPLPTRSTWSGSVTGYVSRAFNNNFWVTTQGINGANSVTFAYDKDGLVTKAGALTQARNAQNGLHTGSTLAGTTDTFTYNTFAEPASYSAKFGTTALYTTNYTRDPIGRIATLKETISGATTTYSYTYDKVGRLTTVKKGATTIGSYTYDNNSNRLSATTSSGTATGTYDAQDRLLTYGAASYTYNGNGELASKTAGTQTTTYQYDVLGNLMAVTLPSGTAISYIVDAENNRVAKKVNGVVVAGFLYDRGNLVAQLDVNNQLVSQFVYGDVSATPVYMVTGGVTYRIFCDHLGSPRLVVNSSTGQIAERIDYDEFGNVINDTNPGFQPFGFAGGLYDQDTTLVRFGLRDYDPATGRWTAKDPIRFDAGDTNLFGYVQNDPVNLIDPTGLEGDCNCKEKDKIKKMVEDFTDRKNVADQIEYQKQVDAAAKAAADKAKDTFKTPETIQKPADAPLSVPTVNVRGFDFGIKSVSKTVLVQGGEVKLTGGVSAMVDKAHPMKLPYGITVPGIIPMSTFECELIQKPH
jgi:RHS repeat-associated protein